MLQKRIEAKFTEAFAKAFPQLEAIEVVVTRSTQTNFGHYQCNSAMKLSKALKLSPREIALAVVDALQAENIAGNQTQMIEKCEVAGPGFINLTLSSSFISAYCQTLLTEEARKKAIKEMPHEKIVIDFSSPNTAKEMHVGHLRSTIIGDCLARVFEYLGKEVLRLNHIGDWGTAFGMLIAYLKQYEPDLLTGKKQADLSLLVSAYKKAKKRFDEDPVFQKQSQLEVVALQQGEKETLQAWRDICAISEQAYQAIYDLLDVRLIHRGESFYNPYLAKIIEDLEGKQLITISEGAKCLFLEGFINREGEPLPFMLQKRDGGYNYATTDMASIYHRIFEEKANRLIYVTDAGQAMHFKMLFAAAEKAKYLDPQKVRVDHVPFGLVLGGDGKKFKTRSGETERLIDLLYSAVSKATEILLARNQKNSENTLSDVELSTIAQVLGINAVKYADLSCNRIHDYVFSYDKMLRFEGNTAAFLMYAYVRIHGIKRKIKSSEDAPIELIHPSEIALGLHLCQFEETLTSVTEDLMPNRLCDYLYELAEKFNAFFRDCRVEGANQQNQRLALCELAAKTLKEGMTLLGLKTVDRM